MVGGVLMDYEFTVKTCPECGERFIDARGCHRCDYCMGVRPRGLHFRQDARVGFTLTNEDESPGWHNAVRAIENAG